MLISVKLLQSLFKVNPRNVLHVGAHNAEEIGDYKKAGWGTSKRIWIEAQHELAMLLAQEFDPSTDTILEACVWSESGLEKIFNNATNTQSSSLLKFETHIDSYPDISMLSETKMITTRIDDLISEKDEIDFLNLDIQGAELHAIRGLGDLAKKLNWIYTEVNWKHLYEDCPLIDELDQELEALKFRRIATRKVFRAGWGDALYIRESEIPKYIKIRVTVFKLIKSIEFLKLVAIKARTRLKRLIDKQ
jgi:FkbM family methyltransferase